MPFGVGSLSSRFLRPGGSATLGFETSRLPGTGGASGLTPLRAALARSAFAALALLVVLIVPASGSLGLMPGMPVMPGCDGPMYWLQRWNLLSSVAFFGGETA